MFDLYPRHGHRTPDQIAEDTGNSFEPQRLRRRADDFDGDRRQPANDTKSYASPERPTADSGEPEAPR